LRFQVQYISFSKYQSVDSKLPFCLHTHLIFLCVCVRIVGLVTGYATFVFREQTDVYTEASVCLSATSSWNTHLLCLSLWPRCSVLDIFACNTYHSVISGPVRGFLLLLADTQSVFYLSVIKSWSVCELQT
jgi:hypothetical protein